MAKQASRRPKPTPKPTPKLPSQSASPPQLASYVKSHKTLPPPKMRALISLYHQADSWITPENLLKRIDDAFVPAVSSADMLSTFGDDKTITMDQLEDKLYEIKNAPKMVQHDAMPRDMGVIDPMKTWSDHRSKRESLVFEALYGVDLDPSGRVMPGLEVVQESLGSLERERKEDEARKKERAADLRDVL